MSILSDFFDEGIQEVQFFPTLTKEGIQDFIPIPGISSPMDFFRTGLGGMPELFITSIILGIFGEDDTGGGGGIGGDVPSNASGSLRNNTRFQATSDRGFSRTSTNPQSTVPIVIGTYLVYGTLIDYFLLGENDKRMFAVIGVAQAPISKSKVFIDNKDVTTLPQYLDVDGGANPDDNKPWVKFIGNGGESGDIVLANSGKKTFNAAAGSGEVATSSQVYFFNVVSGKNEARIFLSVDVPDIVTETMETINADYANLSTKTLIIEYVISGITTTQETTTFTDILLSSGADYTALNGKTLIVRIDSVDRTVTFTGAAVDAATTAAEIDSQLAAWADSIAFGSEIKIYNIISTAGATIVTNGGTAEVQLNLGAANDAQGSKNNINTQTTAITAQVINVDEIQIASNNADNRRLSFTGTGLDQLDFPGNKNFGTTISYSLSLQEKGSDSTTLITSDTDLEMEKIFNGLPQRTTLLVESGGNFYIDASIPNVGWWTFILEVTQATNGSKPTIAIVEVMSDFVLTENGDFSGIGDQTLELEINGNQEVVNFGGGTNTAALAIIDINNQIGINSTATASGDEILIEALADPVDTETIAEKKEIKLIGGTAATSMNFKPLYSETKNYNYPNTGYLIANIIKNNSISGNPRFSFEVVGRSNNPAQALLDIFEQPESVVNFGLELANDIDRESFLNAIDFCDAEGLTANIALLDINYGQTIQILLQAGSLLLVKNAGRYKLIPETDSQIAAVLNQTDDIKLDGIMRGSIQWNILEETLKFNVLRIIHPDASKNYINRDLIIDVDGLVNTENGEEPQIFEDGDLINISDSVKDFRRERAVNLSAVTNSAQALRLGIQLFRKINLINIGLQINVSIINYFLEIGDIIELNVDELDFREKRFRIMRIDENLGQETFGFSLSLLEHFSEIYQ